MTTPATTLVTYETVGPCARIRMDDGKVNAMSPAMLTALHDAFDRAAAEGSIAVLSGRDSLFSAGFDLKVFSGAAPAEGAAMVRLGAQLVLKLLTFPMPVITVTAGHAYPMGAFLMLSADWRIGASGAWRTGFNEVRINMTIPEFALAVGRMRLQPAYFNRTAMLGEMYGPEEARVAGFVDELVPPADLETAVEAAVKRMEGIIPVNHAATKLRARAPTIAAVRAALEPAAF